MPNPNTKPENSYPDHPRVAVGAFVFKDDKVLLVRRAKAPSEDLWAIPGGKVRLGESLKKAAEREIKEETGIDYEIENLSFVQERFFNFNNQEQHEIIFYYKTKENINIKNLINKYTDQGENEMMYLLDNNNLSNFNIVPTFFKEIQFKNISGLKHIVTRE